jgi:hypothetical protein
MLFTNRFNFNSEVPVDSTEEVQLSDHKQTEHQVFSVFEAIIESTLRNQIPHVDFS